MATKKKTAPRKSATAELIVLVPSKWQIPCEDVKKLEEALRPIANSILPTMKGEITISTGVTNGVPCKKK